MKKKNYSDGIIYNLGFRDESMMRTISINDAEIRLREIHASTGSRLRII